MRRGTVRLPIGRKGRVVPALVGEAWAVVAADRVSCELTGWRIVHRSTGRVLVGAGRQRLAEARAIAEALDRSGVSWEVAVSGDPTDEQRAALEAASVSSRLPGAESRAS